MLVGLIDDAITLRPSSKLALEAGIVAVTMFFFPCVGLTPWRIASVALVSFFLLATVNAYNLIDGLDGLAAGIGICSALGIAAIAAGNQDSLLAIQALAIAGALAGFLFFNWCPAKIYMGDCGALPLGFLLGAMALQSSSHTLRCLPIAYAIPLLLMIVPLLDMATVALSRVSRDTPITRRGLDHSHHKLLALGFSEQAAVAICWSIAAVAAATAVGLARLDTRVALLLLPSVASIFTVLALFEMDLGIEVATPLISTRGLSHHSAGCARRRNPWRGMAGVCLDGLLIVAAYFDAFLVRLGPSWGSDRVAALLANAPLILLIAYLSFLGFGVYRAPTLRCDWARLASAAAGAGIALLLISYLLPLMVSGVTILLFVIILFGLLAGSRFFAEAAQSMISVINPHRISAAYVPAAAFAVVTGGEESVSEEVKTSKKVMAQ